MKAQYPLNAVRVALKNMTGLRRFSVLLGLSGLLACGIVGLRAREVSAALDLARQLNQAFVEVAEKVSPSVVVIRVAHRPEYADDDVENYPFFDLLPELRRQYRDEIEKEPVRPSRRAPAFDGEGCGIIFREDGYLLTSSHVVEGAERIMVRLKDGTEFDEAEIVGVDTQSDVAVLKVKASGLKAARLGDSAKTRVGEFAIAIGAPFRLDYSVTIGHVSAKGRRIFSDRFMMDQDFIQTDASINPGNSGGPLVNIEGEVIGINTLIRGSSTGIGFAVPVNLAAEIAGQLIKQGKFTRAWLGISIENVAEARELRDVLPGLKEGVVVLGIQPRGPVVGSDLKPADIITAIDGRPTPTVQHLKSEVRTKPIGEYVVLSVIRGEKELKIKVKPGEVPDRREDVVRNRKPREDRNSDASGIKVQSFTRELAEQFEIDPQIEGVVVTEVESGSLAETVGIKPGEVVIEVNRKAVHNPEEFREAMKKADFKKGVILNLANQSGRRIENLKDTGE